MVIGILGTGTLATALATGWHDAGHDIVVAGRTPEKARALAESVGGRAAPPNELGQLDAALLAVPWSGVEGMLGQAQITAGTPLIDPTNAVEHGVGVLLTDTSAAERIATLAPRAHVVKAFHLFPAEQWTGRQNRPVVPICGDDERALETVAQLVKDVDADPIIVGPLTRARQLEETAGLVIALAFAGADPKAAIPQVPQP